MIDTTDRYIDIKEVTRKLSIARSTVYLWMSTGKFPQPKRIGLGCSRWLESEVMEYMESRPDSADTLIGRRLKHT